MPARVPGVFEKYTFPDDQEEFSAKTFNDLQLMHLQTELAVTMQQKLELSFEELGSDKFTMAQEYYRGKMDALNGLIALHDQQMDRRRLVEEEAESVRKFRQAANPSQFSSH